MQITAAAAGAVDVLLVECLSLSYFFPSMILLVLDLASPCVLSAKPTFSQTWWLMR